MTKKYMLFNYVVVKILNVPIYVLLIQNNLLIMIFIDFIFSFAGINAHLKALGRAFSYLI